MYSIKHYTAPTISTGISMALNPQYEDIGKGFVQQYYLIFDDAAQRPNLVNLYNVSVWGGCVNFLCVHRLNRQNTSSPNLNKLY